MELFLVSMVKKTFTNWKQTFTKALLLNDSDLQCYIQIETDAFSYNISEIFSQLTINNLG